MGARTYRELRTWQLADQLRREIAVMAATGSVLRDRRYCDSIHAAAGSVCRNIAEGFGRRNNREFANFVRIALGSLCEVQDHLDEALARRFVDPATFDRLLELSEHAKASGANLLRWLRENPRAG